MEPISVRFKLSEQEYMAAARLLTFSNTEAQVRLVVSYNLFALGLFLLMMAGEFSLFTSGVAGACTLIALAFCFYYTHVVLARRCYRGDQKFRHGLALTFTDEHIHVQADQIDSKLGWKLYTDVREDESCYVLIYGKDLRMMTVVPKRAFKSKQQERAFRGLLAAHFDQALTARQLTNDAPPEPDYEPASLQPPDWR